MGIDKIDLNNLDKSDWKTFRFDEIAQNISERVDPNNTDLEVYIGLEHIDSESLHIKRFGTPDDVNGQKLKFYKGDIIFGRRRAYQRKAGIATCDGICSAHALVLRANSDVIDPKLFPFFIHSDLFMHRAVDISVGSLSPTVNWGTLKHQGFLLPPIEKQADFSELYSCLNESIDRDSLTYNASIKHKESVTFSRCFGDDGFVRRTYKLSELVDSLEAGVSISCDERSLEENDVAILKTSAITGEYFKPREAKPVREVDIKKLRSSISSGSILINRKNTKQLVGSSKFIENGYSNLYLPDLIWSIKVNSEKAISKFVWNYISTPQFRRRISALSNGTNESMVNISQKDLLSLKVEMPGLRDQRIYLAEFEKNEELVEKLKNKISASRNLQRCLINQVF